MLGVLQELAVLHKVLVDVVVFAISQGPLRLLQQLLRRHLGKALHPVLGKELQHTDATTRPSNLFSDALLCKSVLHGQVADQQFCPHSA